MTACKGGDGMCTDSAEADGLCDAHHPYAAHGVAPVAPAPRPELQPKLYEVVVEKTFRARIRVAVWESAEAGPKAETIADMGECTFDAGTEARAVSVEEVNG